MYTPTHGNAAAAVRATVFASQVYCLLLATSGQPAGEVLATSTFPTFFRSRFNPRTLHQHINGSSPFNQPSQRLVMAAGVLEDRAGLNETSGSAGPGTMEYHESLELSTPLPGKWSNATDQPLHSQSVPKPALEPSSDDCGSPEALADGRFPWLVILEHGSTDPRSRKRTLSKGVLIDQRHVLTTVSSIQNTFPSWVLTGVRLGDAPRPRQRGTTGKLRLPVGTVFLHESKDIAVVRLAGVVPRRGPTWQPVCVPREDHRLEGLALVYHVCHKHREVGKGSHSSSKLLPAKHIGASDCNQYFAPHRTTIETKGFCAWEQTTDNCTGAIGGPVLAIIRDRYHVMGLSSYVHTQVDVNGTDLPSIYVRVGAFRKWISAVLRTELD
ncbi:serine protease 48-like [Anopheles cruzii]|uniref:serine protease 48-like n=1 Tax=Anopheles cruzii TaxID=68878 RepID=UPI0022EC2E5E|nr:serine protease 48-like [Anopheles cruzii]